MPLIAVVERHRERVDDSLLYGDFPVDRQRQLVAETGRGRWASTAPAWRIDDAVHPFATGFGHHDVRITTRWDEGYFADVGCTGRCTSAGTACTRQGSRSRCSARRSATASRSACTSPRAGCGRTWSVADGRSAACWRRRSRSVFGNGSGGSSRTRCIAPSTGSQPSLIRVEADEVTYGLHIIIRFELEQELIEGRLAVADLPEAWNARFKEYLGVEVPDDAHGVLQDVHWAAGLIGYFPTYALGNLIAGQLFQRAHADLPDLDAQLGGRRAPRGCASGCASTSTATARSSRPRVARPSGRRPDRGRSVRRLPEGEDRSGVRPRASLIALRARID